MRSWVSIILVSSLVLLLPGLPVSAAVTPQENTDMCRMYSSIPIAHLQPGDIDYSSPADLGCGPADTASTPGTQNIVSGPSSQRSPHLSWGSYLEHPYRCIAG